MHTLDVAFSVPFLQLPSLIPALFPAYLDEYPTSKCIYDSFVKFLFARFKITTDMQSDFAAWSRKIHTNSFKIPPPAVQFHPSREFQMAVPESFVSLITIPEKSQSKKAPPTSAAPASATKKALCFSLLQTSLSYPSPPTCLQRQWTTCLLFCTTQPFHYSLSIDINMKTGTF